MLHILLTGMHAGTKRKLLGLSSEALALFAKLDEQADARAEERERKRMLLEADLEEKRRVEERKHEERMQTMFMGFMQQMMSVIAGPPSYSSNAPPPPSIYQQPNILPSQSYPPSYLQPPFPLPRPHADD